MGRVEVIRDLLEQDGVEIDAVNEEGETAVFLAAGNNRFEAVKPLVERGADINRADAVGTAALHRISQQCSDDLIQYLIDHGAEARLCCCAACGDEAGTRRSLERDPAAIDEIVHGFNAVGYAIHSWQLDTLRLVLQHGATLSQEDQQHILRISDNDQQLLNDLMMM